jgi:peptidoglycan/xylan/chitin deacetylase (PgdA/CDA1 family)
VLVSERIPATIFVTARWLKRNPQALQRVPRQSRSVRA